MNPSRIGRYLGTVVGDPSILACGLNQGELLIKFYGSYDIWAIPEHLFTKELHAKAEYEMGLDEELKFLHIPGRCRQMYKNIVQDMKGTEIVEKYKEAIDRYNAVCLLSASGHKPGSPKTIKGVEPIKPNNITVGDMALVICGLVAAPGRPIKKKNPTLLDMACIAESEQYDYKEMDLNKEGD